jgi:hypothetical protein
MQAGPFKAPKALPPNSALGIEPLEPLNATLIQVDSFDPVARARLLSSSTPRFWRGRLYSTDNPRGTVAELSLDELVPIGQRIDLTGSLRIGPTTVAVSGNLNAESDQLDLVLLGDALPADLEPGGSFQGLESLRLSRWEAPRQMGTTAILQLSPAKAPAVQGLW